jgi:hypothetical protein
VPEGNKLIAAIEAAHAAALDETLWPEALGALARLFGAVGATLEDFTKQPFGLRYLRVVGLPSRAESEYLAHYQYNNPRADYAFRCVRLHRCGSEPGRGPAHRHVDR